MRNDKRAGYSALGQQLPSEDDVRDDPDAVHRARLILAEMAEVQKEIDRMLEEAPRQ